MEMTSPRASRAGAKALVGSAGAALAALASYSAITGHAALIAAVAGAAGLHLLRMACCQRPYSLAIVAVDAAAFAALAYFRNDSLGFWQLPGPWEDVFRFNQPGAVIALVLYVAASALAMLGGYRALRPVEGLTLIATPFLFNILLVVDADWHMAELGGLVTAHAPLPFAAQVAVGRALTLWLLGDSMLTLLSLVSVDRFPRSLRTHMLFALSGVVAALTPLVANAAQLVAQPIVAIAFSSLCAALAQAGLWGIVYLMTGLLLDWFHGRPPRFDSAWAHWRMGFVKGAIYGGLFIGFIMIAATVLRLPGAGEAISRFALPVGAVLGALLFPLAATVVGSSDGTAPFFGRLRAAYRDPRAPARGVVAGLGVALAYAADLSAQDGSTRFLAMFAVGALSYGGVDLAFGVRAVSVGKRTKLEGWRLYALGALLGGIVAGAIGWYFDSSQLQVVIAKFWAYADVNYRLDGRNLGDFTTYPIFNKYGMINLGEVAGGVRLFWAESVAGVINWSLAAPLFSINYVLLDAALQRSLRPIKGLVSAQGVAGLAEQAVRVLRWGLWMAPIINSFLRQSPDPSWYNQDGAVRSLVVASVQAAESPGDFRQFSLLVFLGLLAYDWLRILIWFDHMGLRVATLVNLSFLGGDRADEAAARFVGHNGRTRAIPDGIRRFGTWAPLLIPFYIPRGAEWDQAWTGAETLAKGAASMPEPVRTVAFAYAGAIAVMAGASAAFAAKVLRRDGPPGPWLAIAPSELARKPERYVFNNGAVGVELLRDGRGAAFVMGAERGAGPIDFIRRPLDPLQPRGHFFYVSEEGETPWSIGFEPARRAGDYRIEEPGFNRLAIVHTVNGVEARMEIAPDSEQTAILSWKIRLTDMTGRARRLRLTSFCEIAGIDTGAYARDLDFAGMHVETVFVRALNAIFARNRLLRSPRADRGETSFFAVRPGAGTELLGYEDSRTRFLGEGSLANPTGCERWRWRKLDDEGKLWTFDPAASFTLEANVAPNGPVEAEFIVGRADNNLWAGALVARRIVLPVLAEADLRIRFYETRAVEPSPALPTRWPFGFDPDGKILTLTERTPRPWAHVMANEFGMATMVSNDGEIFSAFGNARQNALTAFRFDSATVVQPGQVVYMRDLETGETDSVGFTPFQREAGLDVAYEPGAAVFTKTHGDLSSEYVVFVPHDRPCDMRILTLRNVGAAPKRLRVTPFFDIALEESPIESVGKISSERVGSVLLFENPANDFERGIAFAATTLADAATEIVRARFFGGPGRDVHSPAMVETGLPDLSARDDGRRVAAFSANVTLAPGESTKIVIAIGQTATRAEALALAERLSLSDAANCLEAARAAWAERLGKVEIRTNRPDFDRLINTWLPYQLYASRLWGRVGPNQRGGATGYRDQLQDVLPLILSEPHLARAQIVLHASQQFLEGDVLKWWHRAPNGGTGLGQRTKASDPHLWLPYVLTRYVRQLGDFSVLDERTFFLEADPVPEHEDTWIVVPRVSRESATVYEHARLAIEFALRYIGENGLPLLRAGDWNDGIDMLGRKGVGTSVWMGFFLANVLNGFVLLARAKGDEAFAAVCERELASQREALETGWQGDHYALDFSDDGEVVGMANAMTTGWAAYSGACEEDRALEALEGGLQRIERADRVLLLETPFYEHSQPYPGRIADYPPGVRENGGQYSHGASWIVDGFVRLAELARAKGDKEKAARLNARAFEIFEKISPLKKTEPDKIAIYGLIPIQQPADIYDGWGHGGRGGWSWYTGSAARMLSAAYALLGIVQESGRIDVRSDAFAQKGGLQVESIRIGKSIWGLGDGV